MMAPRSYMHSLMPTTNAYDHIYRTNLCINQSSGVYHQVGIKPKDRGKSDTERQKRDTGKVVKGR